MGRFSAGGVRRVLRVIALVWVILSVGAMAVSFERPTVFHVGSMVTVKAAPQGFAAYFTRAYYPGLFEGAPPLSSRRVRDIFGMPWVSPAGLWIVYVPWWMLFAAGGLAWFFLSKKYWTAPPGKLWGRRRRKLSGEAPPAMGVGPLSYFKDPSAGRSFWWLCRRMFRTAAVVAIALVLWEVAGYPIHTLLAYYRQQQCLAYSAPPTQVVCEQDPAAARKLLAGWLNPYHDYWDTPHDNHFQNFTMELPGVGPAAMRTAKPWSDLAYHLDLRPFDANYECGATVFCGERFTPSGERRLLVVQYNTCPTAYIYFSPCVDIVAVVLAPGTAFHRAQDVTRVHPHGVWFTSVTAPPPIRIYAGQADPANRSHFTFRYEIGGKSDTVDGWLRNDNSVTLTPRAPLLKRGYGDFVP